MTPETNLGDLVERAATRSKKVRRRIWVFSLVPVALAAALLVLTVSRIQTASTELDVVQQELAASQSALQETQSELEGVLADVEAAEERHEAARREVDLLRREKTEMEELLDSLRHDLEQATDWRRFEYEGSVYNILKFQGGPEVEALSMVLNLRDQGAFFALGRASLEEGFDSPSLAAFVLEELGLLPDDSTGSARYRLADELSVTKKPQDGDLVVYEFGYTMFYYSASGRTGDFVVGMTPLGILALRPDFAPVQRYLRVEY